MNLVMPKTDLNIFSWRNLCEFLLTTLKDHALKQSLKGLEPHVVEMENSLLPILEIQDPRDIDSLIMQTIYPNYLNAYVKMLQYIASNERVGQLFTDILQNPREYQFHFPSALEDLREEFYKLFEYSYLLSNRLKNISDDVIKHLLGEFEEVIYREVIRSLFVMCCYTLDKYSETSATLKNAVAQRAKIALQQNSLALNALFAKLDLLENEIILETLKQNSVILKKVPAIESKKYKGNWCVGLKDNLGIHEFADTKKEAQEKFWIRIIELFPSLERGHQQEELPDSMERKYQKLRNYMSLQGELPQNKNVFPQGFLESKPQWKGRPVVTAEDLLEIDCPFTPEKDFA